MGIADILQSFNSKSNQLFSTFISCLNEIKMQKNVERNLTELAQCMLLENTMGFAKCINYYIENDVDKAILSLNIDQEEFFLSILHIFTDDYFRSNFFKFVWRFKKYFKLAKAYSFKCIALNIYNQELINMISQNVIEAKDSIVILSDNEHYLRAFINNSVGSSIVKKINALILERSEIAIDLLKFLVFYEDKTRQKLLSSVNITLNKDRSLENKNQEHRVSGSYSKKCFSEDEKALLDQLGSPVQSDDSVLPFQKTPKLTVASPTNENLFETKEIENRGLYKLANGKKFNASCSAPDVSNYHSSIDITKNDKQVKEDSSKIIESDFLIDLTELSQILRFLYCIFSNVDSEVIKQKVIQALDDSSCYDSSSIRLIENFLLDCAKVDLKTIAMILDQETKIESYFNQNKEKSKKDEYNNSLGFNSINVSSVLLSNIMEPSMTSSKYQKFFKDEMIASLIKQSECFRNKISNGKEQDQRSKEIARSKEEFSKEHEPSLTSFSRPPSPSMIPAIVVKEVRLEDIHESKNNPVCQDMRSKRELKQKTEQSDDGRESLKDKALKESETILKDSFDENSQIISDCNSFISSTILDLAKNTDIAEKQSANQKTYRKLKKSRMFEFILNNSHNATIFFLILLINDNLVLENIEHILSQLAVDDREIFSKAVIEKIFQEL